MAFSLVGPLQQLLTDSSRVKGPHPLPGEAAEVVRFLFDTVPQWIQITGAIVGFLAAATALTLLWRNRARLFDWFMSLPRGVYFGLAGVALIVLVGAAAGGGVTWNYMQHDNGFCTGCHVMHTAYNRFIQSEHDTLSCHDCHQQSVFASTRQLYLWVVDRPEKVGQHARVANDVCKRCHNTGESEVWQRVVTTAGHRTHLESDSSVLRNVQCVDCHGVELHRFVPADSTCGQANCHVNNEIKIGGMKNQTALHCVTCHQFTAEVPQLASRDSAAGTMTPKQKECFSCHEMRNVLAEFDARFDPHKGACGMCHNPHTQERPSEAAKSCTTEACHGNWQDRPFHSGKAHGKIASQCLICHNQHRALVDPSDCAGCHQRVAGRPSTPPEVRRVLQRALPFDTASVLRRGTGAPRDSR